MSALNAGLKSDIGAWANINAAKFSVSLLLPEINFHRTMQAATTYNSYISVLLFYTLLVLTVVAARHINNYWTLKCLLGEAWGCMTQIGQQSQMDHRPYRWKMDADTFPDQIQVRQISPPPLIRCVFIKYYAIFQNPAQWLNTPKPLNSR